jgi:hypothetical protein
VNPVQCTFDAHLQKADMLLQEQTENANKIKLQQQQ